MLTCGSGSVGLRVLGSHELLVPTPPDNIVQTDLVLPSKTEPLKKKHSCVKNIFSFSMGIRKAIQIPTRIPEKIVVALFSGILVNSGILVVAGILVSSR